MSLRTCFAFALLVGALGVGLRLALPVRPVDAAMRDTLAVIAATGAPH